MAKEIERKFIVEGEKWKSEIFKSIRIRQGYVFNTGNKTLRVRITDTKAYLTMKGKTTGISRDEFEYEIPVEEAKKILDIYCENGKIEKTRHFILVGGKEWTIDEFFGDNAGLLMAEVELESEEEKIVIPGWAKKEVSHDKHFFNAYLSLHPYKQW